MTEVGGMHRNVARGLEWSSDATRFVGTESSLWGLSSLMCSTVRWLPVVELADCWSNSQPHQKLRYHANYELLFIAKGNGNFQIGDSLHCINSNDILLIGPTVQHGYKHQSSFECVEIRFRLEESESLEDSRHDHLALSPYNFLNPLHIRAADAGLVTQRMMSLYSEYRNHNLGREQLLGLYLIEIFFLLSRSSMKKLEAPPQYQELARAITTQIDANFDRDVCISELLGDYNYHPDYSREIFKRVTGTSISQYLLHRRMIEANRFVTETTLPLKVIVDRVGLTDYYYFLRAFKKHFGISPGTLRKNK